MVARSTYKLRGRAMRFLVLAAVIGLTACTSPPPPTHAYRMAMIPECRGTSSGEYWSRSGDLREDRAPPICTEARATRMELSRPLMLRAFKDGTATISFACDQSKMAAFSAANANRWVILTAGESAVIRFRMLDRPESKSGCSIAGMTTDEAINLCLDFAEELKEDPDQCATQCATNKDGWACIPAE
jgi:hypothetical protein